MRAKRIGIEGTEERGEMVLYGVQRTQRVQIIFSDRTQEKESHMVVEEEHESKSSYRLDASNPCHQSLPLHLLFF